MGAESEELRPTLVMIVDDQRYARLGLALMIRKAPDLYVVAEAGEGQEALEVLEGLNRSTGLPDVVLMDVRMPGMDGISATRAMAQRFPTVKVLVLTTYDEDDYAFGALEVGASGFLLKDVRAAQLAQAVRAVAQGVPCSRRASPRSSSRVGFRGRCPVRSAKGCGRGLGRSRPGSSTWPGSLRRGCQTRRSLRGWCCSPPPCAATSAASWPSSTCATVSRSPSPGTRVPNGLNRLLAHLCDDLRLSQ